MVTDLSQPDQVSALAERNRPEHLRRKDSPTSPERERVETAIREFVSRGAAAEVIADRVLEAIWTDRFYVLSGEEDGWRRACNVRLEDIRLGSNPSFAPPAA